MERTKEKGDCMKGITLVALVVTIVVLLILAGITISYVMGDNSVFKKASEAKLKADIAQWQERLELAKSPVFIEGLGTFDPDKYFDYIQQQEIINNKDTDVIDNEDGTYDVTTKPGYVFLVTLMPTPEKPTDAEIEYLGKTGNLQPKIKGINIVEATKTSFKIKVSARLEGGEVLCYYKEKANVAENETEDDITGYTSISLDSNLAGSVTSGLTAGTTYKVKAVLKKDGVDIGWVSKEVTTTIIVTSITLNKTTTKIDIGKSETLTVTIEPENAENKEVEWTSNATSIATVDQNGKVIGVAVGTATITVTAKDGSDKSASCTVTVEEAESDWSELAEMAKAIANDSTINSGTSQATVTVGGEGKTIKVGEIYKVKYNGEIRRVRVLGFKHDDLVNPAVYGGNHSKAGISFEFYDCIGKHNMNGTSSSDATNAYGWAATGMRTYLEGEEGKGKLSNKEYIKQVKKKYIKTYNSASSVATSNDYLWLLACSEIVNSGYQAGAYATAIASEGSQYKYYQGVTGEWSARSTDRVKYVNDSANQWWLRSPYYNSGSGFCFVRSDGSIVGNGGGIGANESYGVAPGFSI